MQKRFQLEGHVIGFLYYERKQESRQFTQQRVEHCTFMLSWSTVEELGAKGPRNILKLPDFISKFFLGYDFSSLLGNFLRWFMNAVLTLLRLLH